jgi:pimeloyl-ACP methyl ester carboxylesterase
MVADRHAKDIPFFLSGESYGGTLTIHVAKHFQDHPADGPSNFDSFLLVAPAVVADMPPFPVYQILRYILAPRYPNWVPFFMPNPISPDRIWRDDAVRKARTEHRYKEMMIDAGGLPLKLN